MKFKRTLVLLASLHVAGICSTTAAELSAADKQYLSGYEKVRAALASDDLEGAKKSASDLGENGTAIAQSKLLADARSAFEKASGKAKQLATGQSGYHVFHCPMLNKDWVQTSTTVANPYGGKAMVGCGEMQK